jgi:hypothetical protein
MIVKSRQLCFGKNSGHLVNRIKELGENALIKRGTFSTEIVWGKRSYIFPSVNKKDYATFRKGLFLFGKVRSEAQKFINENPNFRLPKEERSIHFSEVEPPSNVKICATDLNHAYWRIALNKGIISQATYKRGLPKGFKSVRLASLSTLGAGRTFTQISDGRLTNQRITIGGDEPLRRVYKLIRFTCFRHMAKLKKMLGRDFLAYKTDCIYYVDTPDNRKLVTDYFNKHNLSFKQLS